MKGSSLPSTTNILNDIIQDIRLHGLPIPTSVPNSKLVTDFLQDDDLLLQQKLDGHRILLAFTGKVTLAINRNGADYANNFGVGAQDQIQIAQRVFQYRNVKALIDCEYIRPSGLWMFDAPFVQYDDIIACTPASPYETRLRVARTLSEMIRSFPVVPTAEGMSEKAQLTSSLIDHKGEGVIVRSRQAAFRDEFFKIKFVKDAECFVIGPRGEKDSVAVGVLRDGKEIEVGACSTFGKGDVLTGDIVTVRYLYLGADQRLVQPRIMHIRSDKTKGDCQWSQLESTNKDVYTP